MSFAGCAWVVVKLLRFRHLADVIQVHGRSMALLGTHAIDTMRRLVWMPEMLSRGAEPH